MNKSSTQLTKALRVIKNSSELRPFVAWLEYRAVAHTKALMYAETEGPFARVQGRAQELSDILSAINEAEG